MTEVLAPPELSDKERARMESVRALLNPASKEGGQVLANFTVEWCAQCRGLMVRCPRCGNNSCNGGSGEDGECPVCLTAGVFTELVYNIPGMIELFEDA